LKKVELIVCVLGYIIANILLIKTIVIKELNRKAAITPNRGGLTYDEKDSPKVLKGIRKWKEIRKERTPEVSDKDSYWESKSSCNAL
jgi:hypothetical protein